MKLFREVKCSDRLPEDKVTVYAGNHDDQELTLETKATILKYCMDFWLEPYELPTEEEIQKAVFDYNGLSDKTMLRWPIPENAPLNKAFYDGIKWALSKVRNETPPERR